MPRWFSVNIKRHFVQATLAPHRACLPKSLSPKVLFLKVKFAHKTPNSYDNVFSSNWWIGQSLVTPNDRETPSQRAGTATWLLDSAARAPVSCESTAVPAPRGDNFGRLVENRRAITERLWEWTLFCWEGLQGFFIFQHLYVFRAVTHIFYQKRSKTSSFVSLGPYSIQKYGFGRFMLGNNFEFK